MMKKIFTTLVVVLILAGCSQGKTGKQGGTSVDDNIPTGINIGERAPELVFESPDGKKIALSSLRGKLVLIDFWAAWCSPCRMENPDLVRIYRQFRNKEFQGGSGFTIYSVSLDRTREAWVGAIKKDGLEWPSHVSDLQGWKSVPAAMYHVIGIPMSFLIDGNGIILATGLRGDYLRAKLEELEK
jgi:thiol-disulfide isomerase/thioredoxin